MFFKNYNPLYLTCSCVAPLVPEITLRLEHSTSHTVWTISQNMKLTFWKILYKAGYSDVLGRRLFDKRSCVSDSRSWSLQHLIKANGFLLNCSTTPDS